MWTINHDMCLIEVELFVTWWFRVTFPSGNQVSDFGYTSYEEARQKATNLICDWRDEDFEEKARIYCMTRDSNEPEEAEV
jgi:hypothetical protein